jgi:hypothetical protein
MTRLLLANVPRWLTWGLVLSAIAGALFVAGWIKPLLEGPDLSVVTVYRPKSVPVQVETVRWLVKEKERLRVKTERVEVPVEVIREVPAKVEQRLASDFGITLPELRTENRELVDILAIPRAPRGGELAVTVNTGSGRIDGTFRPLPSRLIELGGIREAGVTYGLIDRSIEGYYRQDLVRIGPAIVHGRAFATSTGDYGVTVGAGVRF